MQHLRSPDLASAEDFLAFVALGREFPHHPDTAQAVFHALVRCEAYTVFADVFAAYQKIPHSCADSKSKLILQMPLGWYTTAPAAMVHAFAGVQPHSVEILAPTPEEDGYFLVPDDVHDCLRAMLSSDTTALVELAINGSINEPHGVAEAFADSKLQSIEFGWKDDGVPDLADMDNYHILANGLKHCRTLTHIGINHPHFFALHTAIADFSIQGPQLTSVSFNLGPDRPVYYPYRAGKMQIRDFMLEIAKFETLTSVTGNAQLYGGANLAAVFIEPLTGHKALTTLEIEGGLNLPVDKQTLEVVPMVAGLSVSCAALRHFKWAEGELSGDVIEEMRDYLRRGGDLAMAGASNAVTKAMANPAFRLESLTLNGLPFATGVLNAFFAALKNNTTLRHLDLSRCQLDLRSTTILLESLKSNTTLETITLPEEYDDYYLSTRDGNVHGFEPKEPDDDKPRGFKLKFAKKTTAASRALAAAEFAQLQGHANQLFAAIATHNRRARNAATAMETRVV
ncbi:MAG: hypothetical protein Q7T95_06140 [Hydrogenophaga sp.]|nr:hypothetical protein [Hydrogenophaga sp.]